MYKNIISEFVGENTMHDMETKIKDSLINEADATVDDSDDDGPFGDTGKFGINIQ